MPDAKSSRPQDHHEKLIAWGEAAQRTYDKAFEEAKSDPQHAGHIAEQTWAAFLEDWLPPSYTVLTRRYIVPEVGGEMFETDVVVLRPSYPRALMRETNVTASGVAAAFSVKLTLKPGGIREAADSLAKLRRSMHPREGTPRAELHGAFPYGLLALSHNWKAEPAATLGKNVAEAQARVSHPRELLDLICVADLACVTAGRISYLPAEAVAVVTNRAASAPMVSAGYAISDPETSIAPVASFISGLLTRLSFHDPELKPLADGLRLTGTQGNASGSFDYWTLEHAYSQTVRERIHLRWMSNDEWATEYH